jgi:hypothetical protein
MQNTQFWENLLWHSSFELMRIIKGNFTNFSKGIPSKERRLNSVKITIFNTVNITLKKPLNFIREVWWLHKMDCLTFPMRYFNISYVKLYSWIINWHEIFKSPKQFKKLKNIYLQHLLLESIWRRWADHLLLCI